MAWLVGILVLILCVIFWRQSLVILGVGAALLFLVFLSMQGAEERRAKERAAATERTRALIAEATQRVTDAQENSEAKTWRVETRLDPASGIEVPRYARIESDDGLCTMTVEERIDGTRLTSFSCPGLSINAAYGTEVQIKFDDRDHSDKMRISSYSSRGSGAYLSSSQSPYSNLLEYDQFIDRLGSTDKVAILLGFNYAGKHWMVFSLSGSRTALAAIGAL